MSYLVFYKTTDVFLAEEVLNGEGIETEVVPTPVTDKAYCGVCIKIRKTDFFAAKQLLETIEYMIVD